MFGVSYFQSLSPGCLVPPLSNDDKSLKAVAAAQGSGEQNGTVSKKPPVEWCQSLAPCSGPLDLGMYPHWEHHRIRP